MKAVLRLLGVFVLIALSVASARAVPIFGIGGTNSLVRFDSATPGTIVSSTAITGMIGSDTIVALDCRPTDGKLYGLGSASRLYIIDPVSAVATPVGGTLAVALNGSAFGFDFNPTTDRIRITSDTDQNLRVDPNSLAVTIDSNLAYASGDVNFGANPAVVGCAFTSNVVNASSTLLYGIDSGLNILVILNSLNNGTLNTVGPLNVDPTAVLGFDIETSTGTARATMVVGGIPQLYTINLATGAATLVGNIGGSTVVRAMTTAISSFTASLSGTTATFIGTAAANSIVFDQSGGFVRHNRFSNGDAGFASDFDFDSGVAGEQKLSATNAAVSIIVNAGAGDDQVTIGSNSAGASSLAASFQINGQGGGDSLVVNDSTNAVPHTVAVSSGTSMVTGLGGPVTYGTVEKVDIFTGVGDDTINISGTAVAITSVNAGGGSDTVNFADGANLFGGLLDGGGGTDTVDYGAYTSSVVVDLNETQTLFHSLLTGMQEPGPLSSSPASGRGVFVLNTAQTDLSFNIAYTGLTGAPITTTTFNNQVIGVNGPIVRGLFAAEQNGLVTPSGTFSGVWSNSDPTLDPPAVPAQI